MSTRLSRILIDRRHGERGVSQQVLETVIGDFSIRRFGFTLAWGEITVDDLNGTTTKRASIVLRDGTRFAISGLEEPISLQRDRSYPHILLTMVSCRRSCLDPEWCGHPTRVTSVLNEIWHDLVNYIRMAEQH